MVSLRFSVLKVIGSEKTRKRLEDGGWRIISMSSAETEAFVRTEAEKWPRFLREAGIREQ